MVSWKKPTPKQVRRAHTLLTHPESYRYFFETLKNPEWLTPLADLGWFKNPPAPIEDSVRRTIAFPIWPESQWLARMSLIPETRELVAAIARAIPPCSNVRVHEDLTEIALNLPAADAAKLASGAEQWLRSAHLIGLPEKLAELVVHLANGGETEPAMALAGSLLDVSASNSADLEEELGLSRGVHGRFDSWHYARVLEKCVPALVDKAGVRAFDLFVALLERAVTLSRTQEESAEDFSYIWRSAIEDHPQNGSDGYRELLVDAVRDAGEQLARSTPEIVPELVRKLDAIPWKVFHRIALHLLRVSPEAAARQVGTHLVDRVRFEDVALRHEYYLLEEAAFPKLSTEEQKVILGWIDEGPDLEAYRAWRRKQQGAEPPEEDVRGYKCIWQRDRLAPIASSLSSDRKSAYDNLVRQYGEPETPDLQMTRRMTSWVGPTSPKSIEELRSMDLESLLAELRTWEPEAARWMGPSREGLGRDLTRVIAEKPEAFISEARRFRDLDPTYVRAFFSALEEVIKSNRKIDWMRPLELAAWIVEQPREIPARVPDYPGLDTGWGWTRKAIADLLVVALGASDASIPVRFHQLVWTILQPLTSDPEPDAQRESSDPATNSLNTVRGQAMHALVQFGLWLRRAGEEPEGKEVMAALLPKVVGVLEHHLDPEKDGSATVRSVYGYRFPWLLVIDEAWATAFVPQIFPSEPAWAKLRHAAWNTYVIFCAPYDKSLEVLRAEYSREVDHLAEPVVDGSRYDPRERLAEHILTFFWRGQTTLEDDASLINQFFAKAPPELRSHAITFVGHSLRRTPEDLDPIVSKRLSDLWENRVRTADAADLREPFLDEIAAFGWWFSSGKFSDEWAIQQLRRVLAYSKRAEPDHLVVERLAQLPPPRILDAVQCLDAIARGDVEGWGVYSWQESALEIIKSAVERGDPQSRAAAAGLIDYLVRRGHRVFATLGGSATAV